MNPLCPTNFNYLENFMDDRRPLPVFTETYECSNEFYPTDNSIYIYGETDEQRSHHINDWGQLKAIQTIKVTDICDNSNIIKIDDTEISLRSSRELATIWDGYPEKIKVYIDITGLSHSAWAGLIKSAVDKNFKVCAVYVEPQDYNLGENRYPGQIYDLSEKIGGLAPIPGFSTLSSPAKDFILIPLLGFEGQRFKYLLEELEPNQDNIYPLIGLPGFQPWYVFETLKNNMSSLISKAWQGINYAASDCPFRCYYKIDRIFRENKGKSLKIALIGTKPHALAAIMFSLNHPEVEIIYDHPIRKRGRSEGTSRLHVYHISSIVKANPNRNNPRRKISPQ